MHVTHDALYESRESDVLLRVVHDDDVPNPREDEDFYSLGTLFLWDESGRSTCDEGVPTDASELGRMLGVECLDDPRDFAKAFEEADLGVALPVTKDERYGTARYATSPDWRRDGSEGVVGVIYATRPDVEDHLRHFASHDPSIDRMARALLASEVAAYDNWQAGRRWRCEEYDADGDVVDEFTFLGDDLAELEAEYGELRTSHYVDVESWVGGRDTARWSWRDDVHRLEPRADPTLYARVTDRMARAMLDEEREGEYSLDDMLSTVCLGNVWRIPKDARTYALLEGWHGGHARMMDRVRLAVEDADSLYFYTGNGYSVWHHDLFGGAPGEHADAVREFERYAGSAARRPKVDSPPPTRRRM